MRKKPFQAKVREAQPKRGTLSEVNQDSATPLHHQVYAVLRQEIADGEFGPDGKMPNESELSTLFNVSRVTVRTALDRLESEGCVQRLRSKGTFAREVAVPQPIRTSVSIIDTLGAQGFQTTIAVIDFRHVLAPKEIAVKLEVSPGAQLQKTVRVRYYNDAPFCLMTSYVPPDLGATLGVDELLLQPLLCVLQDKGVVLGAAEQTITAKLADPAVASHLGVEIGAALLSVHRTVRDDRGRPIEYLHALYCPENYEYHMALPFDPGLKPTWDPSRETSVL
ncbi:MAG: GntR family transcriptional regulator [Sphingomicrobium sp.]